MSIEKFEPPKNVACRSTDPDNLLKYLVDKKEQPVYRPYIPDVKMDWSVDWPEYEPIEYTHPTVRCKPAWADPPKTTYSLYLDRTVKIKLLNCKFFSFFAIRVIMNWNELNYTINRQSHIGKYEVIDGLPRNIVGRTGICGRGLLGMLR